MILLFLFLQATVVPFLSNDLFEYELNYEFKSKVTIKEELVKVNYNSEYSQLPYLEITFKVDNNDQRFKKYRIIDNANRLVASKKFKDDIQKIYLDVGFTADVKDRTGPHQFTIFLLDEEKEALNRIELRFSEDGDMFVNDEKRGKV